MSNCGFVLIFRARVDRLDVQKEYEKRKAGGKDYINLVVIGWLWPHVVILVLI